MRFPWMSNVSGSLTMPASGSLPGRDLNWVMYLFNKFLNPCWASTTCKTLCFEGCRGELGILPSGWSQTSTGDGHRGNYSNRMLRGNARRRAPVASFNNYQAPSLSSGHPSKPWGYEGLRLFPQTVGEIVTEAHKWRGSREMISARKLTSIGTLK